MANGLTSRSPTFGIDWSPAIGNVTAQILPLIARVRDCLSEQTLRRYHGESGDQQEAELMANGGTRISYVLLCALGSPVGCNPREAQAPGGQRSFF